jgi:hypothetical protein
MSGESGVSKAEFQALLLVVEGLQKRVEHLERQLSSTQSAGSSEFELVVTEPSSTAASTAEAATSLTAERLGAARLIGAWIRRCLRGEPRGLSGREKISLASRFYIVVRDFDLVNYNPPRVFSSWGEAKTLTHRLGQPGDSIFVGVPSRAEVRAVCAAADLETPAAFRQ